MKHLLFIQIIALAVAAFAATAADVACFADYKAKRDDPLRLHYGVVELFGPCTPERAKQEIARRLDGTGWTLLAVLGTFDQSGLDERKDSAGDFYLRY